MSEVDAMRLPDEEASTGVRKASGMRQALRPERIRALVVASTTADVELLMRAVSQPPLGSLIEMDTAIGIESALEALRRDRPQPDAILVAHELAGRSSIEWCEQLTRERPDTPVLLLIPQAVAPYTIDPAMHERAFLHAAWPRNAVEAERLGLRLTSEVTRLRKRVSGEHRLELGPERGRRLESRPASILVIDPYDAARAQAAAILGSDPRFRVQELADPSAALARSGDERHEAYLVMLDRDPAPGYGLIHSLRLGDGDAVIIATDDRECIERAATAMDAGAASHVTLPLHRKDLHQLATRVQRARHEPTQFGSGKQVRIRLDIHKVVIDGVPGDLGKNTERKVIGALCRAYGGRVSEEALLEAGDYMKGAPSARVALRKLLVRFREKLGPYGFCLIEEASTWRLELPGTWQKVR